VPKTLKDPLGPVHLARDAQLGHIPPRPFRSPRRRRPVRIATYLFGVVVGLLVPAMVFAVVVVVAYDRHQRAAVQRGWVETARALVSAVDRELIGATRVLQTLGTAQSLDRGDLATFHHGASRVLATRPGWESITLAESSGRVVVDTSIPVGAPGPALRDPTSFAEVLRTGQPVIGALTRSGGRHVFPIRVPIVRDGAVAYVLTALVPPDAIAEILKRQDTPPGVLAGVFDAQGTVVARTSGAETYVGRPVSPDVLRLLRARDEGWAGVTRTLEGAPVYAAFSRSPTTRWGVALGIPAAAVDGALSRSLTAMIVGGLAVLLLATAVSVHMGRRIARPLETLAAATRGFGRAGRLIPEAAFRGPEEVVTVARALADAAAEQHRAEAERAALLAVAEAARAQAERANRAKDEFLAVLSHEIRNPLNAISGAVAVLERTGMLAAPVFEILKRQAQQLARFVDDLLEVTRLGSPTIQLRREPVALHELVRRTVLAFQPRVQTAGHVLRLESDVVWVDGDPGRLEQIVANLIDNALKYTPNGGEVTVSLGAVDHRAVLKVSDTGSGISPELLPRVFELFVRGSEAASLPAGLGVGLALVQRLVELHGGEVTAASAGQGKGSCFTVVLPRLDPPRPRDA